MTSHPFSLIPHSSLLILLSSLVIPQVVLLNLLIAIMAESFNRIQKSAELEAISERATIIMEAETSWLDGAHTVCKPIDPFTFYSLQFSRHPQQYMIHHTTA